MCEQRTIAQLTKAYEKSDEWVRAELATYHPPPIGHIPRSVTTILDVTYCDSWGVLVAVDPKAVGLQNRVLYDAFLESTARTVEGMAGKPAIPNTPNALDGRFGAGKTLLNRHRGYTAA